MNTDGRKLCQKPHFKSLQVGGALCALTLRVDYTVINKYTIVASVQYKSDGLVYWVSL